MARLPKPGQDNGNWGDILNSFLLQCHDAGGNLKHNIIDNRHVRRHSITDDLIAPDAQISPSKISGLSNSLNEKIDRTGGTIAGSLSLDGVNSPNLRVKSSFNGNENTSDSTGRILLESYQRAQRYNSSGEYAHYGEIMRIYSRYHNSKQMIAWYGPTAYQSNGQPAGSDTAWFWMGAHYDANDGGEPHGHWSLESPDSNGNLQTRFEVRIWDPSTGAFGIDKTVIKTSDADMVVGCSNGSLQLAAQNGTAKNLYFNNDTLASNGGKRWGIQADSASEAGGNTGTDFRINRHTDSGAFLESSLFIRRSNGQVGIGGITDPSAKLDVATPGSYPTIQATQTTTGNTIHPLYGGVIGSANNRYIDLKVNGDSSSRLSIAGNGAIEWGDGISRDTNLYRSEADTLKTDGNFVVTGNLQAPGFNPQVFVRKAIDETVNNSTALQDDNHLATTVAANSTYMVEVQLFYSSSATADMRIGFSAPPGSTFDWTTHSLDASAGSATTGVKLLAQNLLGSPSYGGAGVGSKVCGFAKGILITSGTAGAFKMQWAQNTAEVSDSTIYANSNMRLIRVS